MKMMGNQRFIAQSSPQRFKILYFVSMLDTPLSMVLRYAAFIYVHEISLCSFLFR